MRTHGTPGKRNGLPPGAGRVHADFLERQRSTALQSLNGLSLMPIVNFPCRGGAARLGASL